MNRIVYIIAAALLFIFEANLLGLAALLIGKCFHLQLFACQFFCFRWVTENGRLQFKNASFAPVPDIVQGRMDLTQKEDWTIVFIKVFLQVCFLFMVIFLTLPLSDGKMRFILIATALLVLGLSLYTVVTSLSHGGGTLGRTVKMETMALLNSTGPITTLLCPLEALPYKYTQPEAAAYQLLRATQLWYADRIDEMKEPVDWLENYTSSEFNKSGKVLLRSVMHYYMLLTYYTILRPDADKAVIFYERVKPLLLQDQDANGKRILACYQYYVKNDPAAALETARQAQQAVSSFSTAGREREMERHLIGELIEFLEKQIVS